MIDSQFGSETTSMEGDSLDRAAVRLDARREELRLWEIARDVVINKPNRPIRVASVSYGRAQSAEWMAREFPDRLVTSWFIDSFQMERAKQHIQLPAQASEAQNAAPAMLSMPSNLDLNCCADLPELEYDLAMIPLIATSEAELSRDYLQQLFHNLVMGGRLVVSIDNPEDRWVHDQLKAFEKSVKVRPFDDAVVYIVEKKTPLKKLKNFTCELAYRDCDELIRFITRPGVFSHRQLDNGARQLLDAVDVYPEARLLDVGCGSGSVSLGVAKRDPSATVHAVDSNARSLACLHRSMRLNGLTNITTELNHTGIYGDPARFDMALANPPYFGDFRIAEKFVVAAHRSLRKGGRLVLVTKQPNWYQENLERWFVECEVFPSKRYHIASGVKPS